MSNGDLIKWKNPVTTHVYKGKKNKTTLPDFVKLCKMSQMDLKKHLVKQLKSFYPLVLEGDGYVYAKGESVLLTAHMDTVHDIPVRTFYEDKKVISSPDGIGGDDRCGVYMILTILRTTEYRPTILFCEDEEIGGVGSNKFINSSLMKELDDLKFFIELDRANAKDLVFYDDDNKEFHQFCETITGYRTAYGSFSDISKLCPAAGISGVNISCGYYHAHTKKEEVDIKEMLNSIEAVKKLIEAASDKELKQFEFVQKTYRGYWDRLYGYDDDYFDVYNTYFGKSNFDTPTKTINDDDDDKIVTEIGFYYGENIEYRSDYEIGDSEDENLGKLFQRYPFLCYNDLIDLDSYYESELFERIGEDANGTEAEISKIFL